MIDRTPFPRKRRGGLVFFQWLCRENSLRIYTADEYKQNGPCPTSYWTSCRFVPPILWTLQFGHLPKQIQHSILCPLPELVFSREASRLQPSPVHQVHSPEWIPDTVERR